MIKKNTLYSTIAIITAACTPQPGVMSYPESVALAADKIPADTQQAYFACRFLRHENECREKVWATHPNPTLTRKLTAETVRDFLFEVDLRGAGRVVSAHGHHTCGLPQKLEGLFWERGYEVTCADGAIFRVDRHDDKWQVSKAPVEAL